MSTFNGHKNWNHWNVSLWIANDAGLFKLAKQLKRSTHSRKMAAEFFVEQMHSCGVRETPDGAPYTVTSVKAAMRNL